MSNEAPFASGGGKIIDPQVACSREREGAGHCNPIGAPARLELLPEALDPFQPLLDAERRRLRLPLQLPLVPPVLSGCPLNLGQLGGQTLDRPLVPLEILLRRL